VNCQWCDEPHAGGYVIAIDPGRSIGWAIGADRVVLACGTVRDLDRLPCQGIGMAIVEMPRVYPMATKWKGDPQDIVRLAFLAGRIAARYPEYRLIEPRAWRGNAPDKVITRRTERALAPDEPRGDTPHSWDAIGILLHHWERRARG
jgi:hypothetical protein